MGRSDAEIIAESLRRPQAFAKLFDRYWRPLHAFCTSRAAAAGEDIAQETFRRAFDRRDGYDQSYDDAGPWLYGIATNLLRQHFRSAQRRGNAEDRSIALIDRHLEDLTIGELERQLLGPDLASALDGIPEQERDALLLMAWADMEYAEIARALGVPVGTVRSRIHRARRRLQTALDQRTPHDA